MENFDFLSYEGFQFIKVRDMLNWKKQSYRGYKKIRIFSVSASVTLTLIKRSSIGQTSRGCKRNFDFDLRDFLSTYKGVFFLQICCASLEGGREKRKYLTYRCFCYQSSSYRCPTVLQKLQNKLSQHFISCQLSSMPYGYNFLLTPFLHIDLYHQMG